MAAVTGSVSERWITLPAGSVTFQKDGTARFSSKPLGVLGAAQSYTKDTRTFVATLASIPNILVGLDVWTDISCKLGQAFSQAGSILAIAPATGHLIKIFQAGYYYCTHKGAKFSKTVLKVINEALRFFSKAAHFTMGLVKSHVITLGKTPIFALEAIKNGFTVLADLFDVYEAIKKFQKLKGQKALYSTESYKRAEFLRIVNIVKTVAAILFHATGCVALFLPFKVGPVLLITGPLYALASLVSSIAQTRLRDSEAAELNGAEVVFLPKST
jgi:hypothetical protein